MTTITQSHLGIGTSAHSKGGRAEDDPPCLRWWAPRGATLSEQVLLAVRFERHQRIADAFDDVSLRLRRVRLAAQATIFAPQLLKRRIAGGCVDRRACLGLRDFGLGALRRRNRLLGRPLVRVFRFSRQRIYGVFCRMRLRMCLPQDRSVLQNVYLRCRSNNRMTKNYYIPTIRQKLRIYTETEKQ